MMIANVVRDIRNPDYRCWENGTDRWRIWIGDLARWNENEGGYRSGSVITFEIGFGDHVGDFDIENYDHKANDWIERRHFLTRWITVQIGRWGVTFNWRGPEITDTDWGIPRWKLGADGELLEEWL